MKFSLISKTAILSMLISALTSFDLPMHTFTIDIKNIRFNLGGKIFLMVVDKNDKPVHQLTRDASEKNATFVLKNLPTGQYAVRAFHDQNNNGVLDKGVFGQPIEGWGVSNDARGFMSAPPFKKMLVWVSGNTQTTFRMDY